MDKYLQTAGIIIIPVLLFFITPVWNSYFEKQKEIQYEIVKNESIGKFGFSGDKWNNLVFEYDGQPILEGGFVLIGLENTGTVPINSRDFESPILFDFDSKTIPVDYRIMFAHPDYLDVDAEISDTQFKIMPMLLNPGDKLYIEILVQGSVSTPVVTSRISGITHLSEKKQTERNGIYLERVIQDEGTGTSTHRAITEINEYIALFISYSFLTVFFISIVYSRQKQPLTTVMETLIYITGLSILTISVMGFQLGYFSILIFFLTAIFAYITGYFFAKWFNKKVARRLS